MTNRMATGCGRVQALVDLVTLTFEAFTLKLVHIIAHLPVRGVGNISAKCQSRVGDMSLRTPQVYQV